MESQKKLFTTGEFADICGIKKQTLYHYDEIDLLNPEYKSTNGYRYYSLQQTEIFFVIEMFKDIGMSLAEIKAFLYTKNPHETIGLLEEKELILQDKILKMQQTQHIIQNKKRQIEEALTRDFEAFTIEEMQSEHYILSESILDNTDKEFTKSVISFMKHTKREVLDTGYPVGGLIHQDQIEEGNYWDYHYLYMRVDDKHVEKSFIKKTGEFVVGYHKGSYLKIDQTYEKIKAFLYEQGYRISGDSFEEYVMDEMSVSGEDNYVTKIMIEVNKI